jgi:hypothetical protein
MKVNAHYSTIDSTPDVTKQSLNIYKDKMVWTLHTSPGNRFVLEMTKDEFNQLVFDVENYWEIV